MKKILITGAGSYVGESVRRYILSTSADFEIDAVDTLNDAWKEADFSKYDVVYHVAGIAHVNADPKMEALYYKVNRDLTIEVAKAAKAAGDKKVEMLPMKDLLATTGYIRGGCSPIGMKKKYPTFIHESALLYDYIFISAGVRGLQIKIAPADLIGFVGAEIYPL